MFPIPSGLLFSLLTVLLWGSLPLALQQAFKVLSPATVVAVRFLSATLILGLWLGARRRLPPVQLLLQPGTRRPLLFGMLGLVGNFWLYSASLLYLPAAAAQVLAQLSPFMLMAAGVLVLGERLAPAQKIGALLVFLGILLFFNRQLPALGRGGPAALGIALGLAGAVVWAGYGLSQKILLRHCEAQPILLLFYAGCSLLALPCADWASLARLDGPAALALLYCCLNTPIAYGAFGEALRRWEVAKVSTVITLVPLATIGFAQLGHRLAPERFAAPDLNGLALAGALLVVVGASVSALARRQRLQ